MDPSKTPKMPKLEAIDVGHWTARMPEATPAMLIRAKLQAEQRKTDELTNKCATLEREKTELAEKCSTMERMEAKLTEKCAALEKEKSGLADKCSALEIEMAEIKKTHSDFRTSMMDRVAETMDATIEQLAASAKNLKALSYDIKQCEPSPVNATSMVSFYAPCVFSGDVSQLLAPTPMNTPVSAARAQVRLPPDSIRRTHQAVIVFSPDHGQHSAAASIVATPKPIDSVQEIADKSVDASKQPPTVPSEGSKEEVDTKTSQSGNAPAAAQKPAVTTTTAKEKDTAYKRARSMIPKKPIGSTEGATIRSKIDPALVQKRRIPSANTSAAGKLPAEKKMVRTGSHKEAPARG